MHGDKTNPAKYGQISSLPIILSKLLETYCEPPVTTLGGDTANL